MDDQDGQRGATGPDLVKHTPGQKFCFTQGGIPKYYSCPTCKELPTKRQGLEELAQGLGDYPSA